MRPYGARPGSPVMSTILEGWPAARGKLSTTISCGSADIAERLGISRPRVSVLVSPSDFPSAVGRLGRSDVSRWPSVEPWAREMGRLEQAEEPETQRHAC